MAKDVNRSGVDGWLLVFILLLGIVAPIYYLFDAYRVVSSTRYLINSGTFTEGGAAILVAVIVTLTAVMLGLLWLAAWRLWRVFRWSSVRLAIAVVWFVFVGIVLIDMFGGIVLAPDAWRIIVAGKASAFATGMVLAFGATVYLTSARRVANTYRRPGSLGEANDVFD